MTSAVLDHIEIPQIHPKLKEMFCYKISIETTKASFGLRHVVVIFVSVILCLCHLFAKKSHEKC